MLHRQNSNLQYQTPRPEPRQRRWPGRLLLVLVLLTLGWVIWQRQAVRDWIQLFGYQPPTQVSALATQTTMTSAARHLFYLNKPIIANKDNFAGYCTTHEQTIVLGCYHGGQDGIFILKIDDKSELHGVMQVTAAHEMLHAAYDRLSATEKTRVDGLLQNYYDNQLKDKAIKAEIDDYRRTEPGQLLNEMHSIFGTEVADLPTGLAAYYKQYFGNRSAIVAQAESYQAAFRSREQAVKKYDAQLESLRSQITSNEALLATEAKDLTTARKKLDSYKNSGNITAYNAAVPTYNSAVRDYNALLATTKRQVSQFNAIVAKRNVLVVEEQDLVKQLNGDSLPSAQ